MSSRLQGPAKFEQIGQGSEVVVQGVPNWDFLYNASTTKLPEYNIGDRVVTPDGRVFRYSLAGGTIHTEFMVCDPDASITNAVAPTQVNPTSPVILGINLTSGQLGSYCVTITVGPSDGKAGNGNIAQDEMKGGFVVIGNGSIGNQHPMTRGILGNEAVTGGGSMNVYIDGALTRAVVVGTDNCEAYLNVYGDVKSMNSVNSAYVTAIGAAAAEATVGQYFWTQTWGNVWLTSNGLTGEAANGRDLYVNTDGSLRGGLSTFQALQRVGVGLDKSTSTASNGPNVMLQISI